MLSRFRRNKSEQEGEDDYGVSIGIVEEESDSTEEEQINKGKSKFKLRHLMVIGMLITTLTAIYVFKVNDTKIKEEEERTISEQQQYIAENTDEPHKSLAYYLREGTLEERLDASARSIGHSMTTGCSTTYNALRDNFKDESLIYIQDYLSGQPCEEYSRAAVVRLSQNNERYEYLLTIKDRRERFVISIGHNNEKPTSFKVNVYEKNELTYQKE